MNRQVPNILYVWTIKIRKSLTTNLVIILLDVDFKKITIRLHFLFKSFVLAKFPEDLRSITMLSIKYFNFNFW